MRYLLLLLLCSCATVTGEGELADWIRVEMPRRTAELDLKPVRVVVLDTYADKGDVWTVGWFEPVKITMWLKYRDGRDVPLEYGKQIFYHEVYHYWDWSRGLPISHDPPMIERLRKAGWVR